MNAERGASSAPVGILGGTFDPIHFGHLRAAEEAAEVLRLAEVRFVPAARPGHRARPGAPAGDRLRMTALAVAGNPRFVVDARELARAGTSYTFDTLTELRAELGGERPLVLILGADAFLDLATWHRWQELFALAHIVVAHRPGFAPEQWPARMAPPLARELDARRVGPPLDLGGAPAGGIVTLPVTALDISATRIREALARGASARYLIPDAVLDYIRANRLYSA